VHSFRRENNHQGPILAHCSAGAGRTGSFIGSYQIYERLCSNRTIDPYEVAYQMRVQRQGLGGNEKQYQLLFEVYNEVKSLLIAEETRLLTNSLEGSHL
jgi:protein tyrosine phosphatase